MARVLLIVALVATVFWVYTVVDCAVQPGTRHRGVSKPVWVLIVLLIPVLGGLLWLTVGRLRASRVVERHAPDDDPEFLGRIGSISDQDERIRRLEEELAQLDAEADDPRWGIDGPAAPDVGPEPRADRSGPSEQPGAAERPGDDDGRGQRGTVG